MAVQRYSRQEMQAIISSILKTDISIKPIGNHELKRHLVYNVKTSKGNYVFKYYYQSKYGGREISTLKLIENTNIKSPKLIASGTFGEEREWLMMNLLDGLSLNKVFCEISTNDQVKIFKEMGIELAKLHEFKTFPYFGNLKEDLSYEKEHKYFKDAFLEYNEYVYKKIENNHYDDKDILVKALKIIRNNLHLLDTVKEARLTHLDFCPRNIFITRDNTLKAVLDYELCRPWDKNADFAHLFLKNFPNRSDLEESFFNGYNEYSSLDSNFHKTFDFYMLNLCISICSWAKKTAPDYYQQAFKKLTFLINESKNLRLN